MISYTDPAGGITRCDHDPQNSLTELTDFGHDANDNLTSVQLPTGARSTLARIDGTHPYYPASSTDAQGNTTSVSYDADDNVTTVSLPATTNGARATICMAT